MHKPVLESCSADRSRIGINMPMVAAIVGNFNQKAYVEAAITSVMRQTYPYLECVIVDDCSTDGSSEVISRVLSDGPASRRFKFIQHTENRGQMAVMMSGLDATTAPFVAWLDADDIWFPEFVERHIAHHLNSQANAAISTSNMLVIDADGTVIAGADPTMSLCSPLRKRRRFFPVRPAALTKHGEGIDINSVDSPAPIFINRRYESWVWSPTSGMTFRRTAVEAIRPLQSDRLRTCADNYLARFSHVVGGTIWTNETLSCYRIHGSNNFAKQAVCGDGPIGVQLKDNTEEGNYQFVVKLQEFESLITRLSNNRDDIARLLVEIGRSPRVIEKILANKKLSRALRLNQRMRLLRRYFGGRLRLSSEN